jgi:hypothetical protein
MFRQSIKMRENETRRYCVLVREYIMFNKRINVLDGYCGVVMAVTRENYDYFNEKKKKKYRHIVYFLDIACICIVRNNNTYRNVIRQVFERQFRLRLCNALMPYFITLRKEFIDARVMSIIDATH